MLTGHESWRGWRRARSRPSPGCCDVATGRRPRPHIYYLQGKAAASPTARFGAQLRSDSGPRYREVATNREVQREWDGGAFVTPKLRSSADSRIQIKHVIHGTGLPLDNGVNKTVAWEAEKDGVGAREGI